MLAYVKYIFGFVIFNLNYNIDPFQKNNILTLAVVLFNDRKILCLF